jgi:pimeloyl-ACP methyl ester carboxylesterase
MDATQTDRAIIVSFSLGAQRALLLAADHRQRVEAAVFIGPTYPGGGEPTAGADGVRLRIAQDASRD